MQDNKNYKEKDNLKYPSEQRVIVDQGLYSKEGHTVSGRQ